LDEFGRINVKSKLHLANMFKPQKAKGHKENVLKELRGFKKSNTLLMEKQK
jgi:hypothetical protein